MIKFHDIGAYKNAINVAYCVVPAGLTLKNGMGVTADIAAKTVALPTADTAKLDVFLVMNRIDKPEIYEPDLYTIEAGECPRLFNVKSLDGFLLDVNSVTVTNAYADIAAKDKLTFGTSGLFTKTSDVTGYATYFEVIEKTTFGGEGLLIKAVATL